ncbi:MAG: hypothetical protein ACFE9S_16805 [Candidatus Hermodarchaeota archaeon]
MGVKEDIIEKIIIFNESEEKNTSELEKEDIEQDRRRFLGRLPRKYRLTIVFLVCLSIILLIMMFPVLILIFTQNIGG